MTRLGKSSYEDVCKDRTVVTSQHTVIRERSSNFVPGDIPIMRELIQNQFLYSIEVIHTILDYSHQRQNRSESSPRYRSAP